MEALYTLNSPAVVSFNEAQNPSLSKTSILMATRILELRISPAPDGFSASECCHQLLSSTMTTTVAQTWNRLGIGISRPWKRGFRVPLKGFRGLRFSV